MITRDMIQRADAVRDTVSARPTITVTQLARSKDWRKRLPKEGVIEITDRGDTAGWLLSPEDMTAIVEGYTYLEEELERTQVAALFDARENDRPLSGEALKDAVAGSFEARKDRLRSIIDGR